MKNLSASMIRWMGGFAALVLSSMLIGCGNQGVRTVIVPLVDSTASTGSAHDRYAAGLERILQACRGGEHIVGDTITADSLATQSCRLDVSIPAYDPLQDTALTFGMKKRAALSQARQEMKKLLAERRPERGTDLLNAFSLAAKVFQADENRGAHEKALVVFSDMLEQTRTCDFASLQLDDAQIRRIIARERAAGRLPDLRGVEVWVAGAAASSRDGLSSDRIYRIQTFWLRYFKSCGANLPPAHYGTTLLDFHLSGQ